MLWDAKEAIANSREVGRARIKGAKRSIILTKDVNMGHKTNKTNKKEKSSLFKKQKTATKLKERRY